MEPVKSFLKDFQKSLSKLQSSGAVIVSSEQKKIGELQLKIEGREDVEKLKRLLELKKNNTKGVKKDLQNNESSGSESNESEEEINEEVGALLGAAAMGDVRVCDHLILQRGVNVNSRDPTKLTALHVATHENKSDVVNLLLSRGADVNFVDRDGDTPLMVAVIKKHKSLIQLLLQKGTDLKIRNKRSFTAADLAFFLEDMETLDLLEGKEKAMQFDAKVHELTILSLVVEGKNKQVEYWLTNYPKFECVNPCNIQYKNGRTIAFAAALSGSMDLIQLVHKLGGDLDLPDSTNSSPLFCAAQNGHEGIVELLIEKNCDVNRLSNTGRTALFSAIVKNHTNIAKMLTAAGADVNIKDKEGDCPLACCVVCGSQEIFNHLIYDRKAVIDVEDNNGHSLVMLAAHFQRPQMLKQLHSLGLPLDRVNAKNGETALLAASQTSSIEAVEFLINEGCEVNRKNKKDVTPALRAAVTKNVEIVKLLAKNGAKLDVPNMIGQSAILVAAQKKCTPLVKYLCNEGYDLSVVDDLGCSLAHGAAATNNMELLEFLRDQSAPLDLQDGMGRSPMMVVVSQPESPEMLKALMESGCNCNMKDIKGNTAAGIAATQGSVESLQFLIANGGDLLNITTSGKTVLMQASKNKQLEVLKTIQASNVQPDVNARDNKGRTAVHFAAASGSNDIIEFLVKELRANCDVKDREGCTPFMLATANDQKPVAEKLINFGADINLRNNKGENSTHLAVKSKNLEMLRFLSLKMCCLDQEDNQGVTPLMLACKSKSLEITNFLISKNCASDTVSLCGRRLIHAASEGGSLPIVRRVINLGVPVGSKDTSGITALMLAASGGFLQIVKALVQQKKELVRVRDDSGKTALDYAILADRTKVVQLLVDSDGNFLVNNVMSDGRTSLLLALEKSVKEKEKVARLLIRGGADPTIGTPDGLNSAHVACKFNKLLSMKMLIEKGVKLDVLTEQGDSCLTLAVPKACPELIGLLVDSGLDVRLMNSQQHSALSLAVQRGDDAILSKILPINAEDAVRRYSNEDSLLHLACEGGSKKVTENFLDEQSTSMHVDVRNGSLETPLHIACRAGSKDVVTLLLQRGADFNAKDEKGETPIFHALAKGSHSICTQLIDSGADLNSVNSYGMSVLAKAYFEGQDSIVRLLKSQAAKVSALLEQVPEKQAMLVSNLRNKKIKILRALLTEGLSGDTPGDSGHLLHHAIEHCRSDIINLLLEKKADVRVKNSRGFFYLHGDS